MTERCKADVHDSFGVTFHRCANKAVTADGLCLVHDPDRRAARRAKRPPTRYERECEARKAREDAKRELLEILTLLHSEMLSEGEVGWPNMLDRAIEIAKTL